MLIGLDVLGLWINSSYKKSMVVFYLRGIDTTLGWLYDGINTFSELIKDWILQ